MEFENSTQARSWLFDQSSLEACRFEATKPTGSVGLVRKFASGFHIKHRSSVVDITHPIGSSDVISSIDQETIIRFHAHHIRYLVGPFAVHPELRTGQRVLLTAITFLRRFYLSNSVVDYHPRPLATACVFLASKIEESYVNIQKLAYTTDMIARKLAATSLGRQELSSVSVAQIEEYERYLMEGLNYELICHQPDGTIEPLAFDVARFLKNKQRVKLNMDDRDAVDSCDRSESFDIADQAEELHQRASALSLRASIVSDVPFLFSPVHIGFAAVSLAMDSVDEIDKMGFIGDKMQAYIVDRYPLKTEEEILEFSRTVSQVMTLLLGCPLMVLKSRVSTKALPLLKDTVESLRRVSSKVANIRLFQMMNNGSRIASIRKRANVDDHCCLEDRFHKAAKITPMGRY